MVTRNHNQNRDRHQHRDERQPGLGPESTKNAETTTEATLLAALATGDEATFVGLGNMVVPGLAWKAGDGRRAGGQSRGGRQGWGGRGHGREAKGGNAGGAAGSGTLAERLAALGFVPGAKISVESNTGRGPLIVNIRGARVAIGRGQAGKMLVRRRGVGR